MNFRKPQLHWTWILIIAFFALSFYSFYFGIAAVVCMMMPLYFSISGKGKVNCSHYCPRGSFLGKFLPKFSLNKTLPSFIRNDKFKHGFFLFMIIVMTVSLITSGGNPAKIGFVFFRLVMVTTIAGVIMGVIFTPRSWCQVCPMGHASGQYPIIKHKISNKIKEFKSKGE